jgi:hypothetical protein
MPEPPPEKSAGPVWPGRGTMVGGRVAMVTGAGREVTSGDIAKDI